MLSPSLWFLRTPPTIMHGLWLRLQAQLTYRHAHAHVCERNRVNLISDKWHQVTADSCRPQCNGLPFMDARPFGGPGGKREKYLPRRRHTCA